MFKISQLAGFGAGVVGIPTQDSLLLESGDYILLENASKIILDNTGDNFFSSVVLLLPFNEADGLTETTDFSNSSHVITFQAGAEIDSAQSKWGNSLLLDGSSTGQLSANDHADWAFGSSPFTIEAWIRFSAAASNEGDIAAQYNPTGNQRSWIFRMGSSQQVALIYSFNGSSTVTLVSAVQTINDNTFYHVAVTRDTSHDIRLFLDGELLSTDNIGSSALKDSNAELRIGNRESGGGIFATGGDGWIEDLRITKGIARYVGNFTPTGPHRHPNE